MKVNLLTELKNCVELGDKEAIDFAFHLLGKIRLVSLTHEEVEKFKAFSSASILRQQEADQRNNPYTRYEH